MGGLRKELPLTYWTFVIGALAIAGVPGLAGFFSKDEILYRTFAGGHVMLWAAGLVTSLLTAIYMFRVVFLAFHGDSKSERARPSAPASDATPTPAAGAADTHGAPGHLHDAPAAMALALVVLAAGSIVAGYVGLPHALGGSNRFEQFLEPSLGHAVSGQEAEAAGDHPAETTELTLMAVSSVVALSGIGLAAFFFLKRTDAAEKLAAQFGGLRTLLLNKYYVDEIYDAVIVQPIRIASENGLWKVVDAMVIDGAVNGVAEIVAGTSALMRRLQTGAVRTYAASLFLGVVLILGYYLL